MEFDKQYILDVLLDLLNTDSPTGMTDKAADKLCGYADALGYPCEKTNKGGLTIRAAGHDHSKTVGACAHLDTLGLMVRAVKPNGALAVTKIGGAIMPTLDGEYCRIYTRGGAVYTGTILSTSPASHVYGDAHDKPRTPESMEIRVDEPVRSAEDTKKLGISAGDFICIEPKACVTPSGFIKSRFLDDKLCVAMLLGVLKAMKDSGRQPRYDTAFMFSVYEEVGHGVNHMSQGLSELLIVDMGCVGDDLTGSEYGVSICAKDSSGPYDYGMTGRLIALAQEAGLEYAVDIYPSYASDASTARAAGWDVRTAAIGPGVHASHGMERSHYSGVENAMKLVSAYLMS